jgi:hypothetical protein
VSLPRPESKRPHPVPGRIMAISAHSGRFGRNQSFVCAGTGEPMNIGPMLPSDVDLHAAHGRPAISLRKLPPQWAPSSPQFSLSPMSSRFSLGSYSQMGEINGACVPAQLGEWRTKAGVAACLSKSDSPWLP